MMMMIASNSLARQKEGAQGEEEEEEEARNQRKRDQMGTPTPGADGHTGPTRSGVSHARNKRKHGRWNGILLWG